MKDLSRQFEANKEAWNLRTPYHVRSDFFAVASFKKSATSLRSIEIEELGNIEGKTLLHLMCHFRQDTLSLARMEAKPTGIDFSEKAVAFARKLADEQKLDAEFHCCNLYDTRKHVHERFDIVYTSYGVIGGLPELGEWGRIISESLKPGGTFHMVEFHPFIWMLDDDRERSAYSYFHSETPLELDIEGTYADRTADIASKDFNWVHSLSDVVNSLIGNGLEIETLREFPYTVYECFPNLERIGEQKWILRNLWDKIPYLFSLKARKKA
jgi:SAM-dependent methyltransferase